MIEYVTDERFRSALARVLEQYGSAFGGLAAYECGETMLNVYFAWRWLSYAIAHPHKIPDVLAATQRLGVKPTIPHVCLQCYWP